MEAFLPFLAATIVGCALSALGYWFARRAGLLPVQTELVKTLKEINEALDKKLGLMQDQLNREKLQVEALSRRVETLEDTIVSLTTENHTLKGQKEALERQIAARARRTAG